LYVLAALCWMPGRIEEAIRYCDAFQTVVRSGGNEMPFSIAASLGSVYLAIGQPERSVEWCRAELARGRDTHAFARASLVIWLTVAGSADEAMALAQGLIGAAEATGNPSALCYALFAYGLACRDMYPAQALDALRRDLVIAQDSGNSANVTHLAANLARLEAEHGDPLAALDQVTLAIHNYHDSGSTDMTRTPLAVLVVFLDRRGHHEAAATIAGFALTPFTATLFPEITTSITHLREVLGDQTYEQLARKGETMTTAAMVTYAYGQIDQARTELKAGPK
jgi:tetratricopeptide (TPR) repeat protein